ncbi:helix-hairpin-helix domain-containing protein [bacterium]|nr:helix-hairpin-helix domain-containing protein [bacterium]
MQRAASTDLQLRVALLSLENQIFAAMENDSGTSQNDWDAPSEAWGLHAIQEEFGKSMQEAYPGIELTGEIEDDDSKVSLKSDEPDALQAIFQQMGRGEMESERLAKAVSACLKESPAQDPQGENAKNAPSETALPDLRFLLKIPSIDHAFVFGEDCNFNNKLDENENDGATSRPIDNGDGVLQRGIGRVLTIHGDGKINPNFASREVLETVPGISDRIAEEIVWKRNGSDGIPGTDDDYVFQKVEDLKELRSISKIDELEYNKMTPKMRVTSNTFTLRLCATHLRSMQRHRIQMVVKRGKGKITVLSCLEDFGS